jgi:hypothetical protein
MHFVSDHAACECGRGQRASQPTTRHGHHLATGNDALGFIFFLRRNPARRDRTEPAGTESAGDAVPEYGLQCPVRWWRRKHFFRLRLNHGERFIRRFDGVQLEHLDVRLNGGIEQRFRHSSRRHRPRHAGRESKHPHSQHVRCSLSVSDIFDVRNVHDRTVKRDRICRRVLGRLKKVHK